MADVSLEKLLETGAHFGHQTKRWNPKMEEFVYGVRQGVYIFDLIKTRKAIEDGLNEIEAAAKDKKLILLLGTKKQVKEHVKRIGQLADIAYVDERWLGGTLTNFEQIKASVKTLNKLKEDMAAGLYKEYTKKERLLLNRKIEKLEKTVGGLQKLTKLPDLMIIVDTKRERAAVLEAQKLKVDIVGIVDTNGDPHDSTYPIPMNDDSPQALTYIMGLIEQALMVKASPTKKKTAKEDTPKKATKKVTKKGVKETK